MCNRFGLWGKMTPTGISKVEAKAEWEGKLSLCLKDFAIRHEAIGADHFG